MAASKNGQTIESLLDHSEWERGRALIQRELSDDPNNHWLLTQLGVTYYEQGRYQESLQFFRDSLQIVPDCPLTLWNLAGALDSLEKPTLALPIYTWILRSQKSSQDDPCWESEAWTDSLKTDCVYRIGVCFQHLGRWVPAEQCFRQFINLLLAGKSSIYTYEDAARRIREAPSRKPQTIDKDVRDVIQTALQEAGIQSYPANQRQLLKRALADVGAP